MTQTPDAVQRYVDSLTDAGRTAYLAVRAVVLRQAPTATETLSYSMPTFLVDGSRLMHVSAWKEHLSIYPLPPADDLAPRARAALEVHSSGASTLKLPYAEPFPTDLVDAVVRAHLARLAAGR